MTYIMDPIHEQIKSDIWELRSNGYIGEAISKCEKATQEYPDTYFYPKILGDLYSVEGFFTKSIDAYTLYLQRIRPIKRLFIDFTKRYFRVKRSINEKDLQLWIDRLSDLIVQEKFHPQIITWLEPFIGNDKKTVRLSEEGEDLLNDLKNEGNFNSLVRKLKNFEKKNSSELILIIEKYTSESTRSDDRFQKDFYCISVCERNKRYQLALDIGIVLIKIRQDPILIRTIFRLCRKLKDYTVANQVIEEYPQILKTRVDFNILYELVYYFEYHNDLESLESCLNRIEKAGGDSIPIQKTVKNFYISFGLLEDVKRVDDRIITLLAGNKEKYRKFSDAVKESEEELSSKVKQLYSRVEHHERLAAISDLTTGISHELGQPITNIRYTIQFYQRQFQKSFSMEKLYEIFESILTETQRMGDLVKRLSPLTSKRNVLEKFDVVHQILKRVKLAENRLISSKIKFSLNPNKPIFIVGDSIHFDQIINNLLFNAIDSIDATDKKYGNEIAVEVKTTEDEVRVEFSDTGQGIDIKNRGKIFDPFYTTKEPGKGEGLGLFIIWNLLKMHGGKIELNAKYKKGAQFIIILPKITKVDERG